MSLLKEVLGGEVYPAVGCTEPVACALATAMAAEHLPGPVVHFDLKVDMGTFKNGAAVTVPHAGGAKGNLIAAALGAVLARSEKKLGLLADVTPQRLADARALLSHGAFSYETIPGERDLRIDAFVRGNGHSSRCVISMGHTNVERIERDGEITYHRPSAADAKDQGEESVTYRDLLRRMTLSDLLAPVRAIDEEDRSYLRQGIEMNLAMAEHGDEVSGAARQLRRMREIGVLAEDLFYRVKLRVASAVDARMAGVPAPVMTSGGSGNQGILAILVPHLVGTERGIDAERILESIAAAHLINAYIKSFVGELSVICGCAVAAACAAAVAIVYQHQGINLKMITAAVNNVVGDLSGLICDGAKPGCTMKTVSGVDAAMRSAFMAIEGFGLDDEDGLLGQTAEETITNLGRITLEGMFPVDPTLVSILGQKAARAGTM